MGSKRALFWSLILLNGVMIWRMKGKLWWNFHRESPFPAVPFLMYSTKKKSISTELNEPLKARKKSIRYPWKRATLRCFYYQQCKLENLKLLCILCGRFYEKIWSFSQKCSFTAFHCHYQLYLWRSTCAPRVPSCWLRIKLGRSPAVGHAETFMYIVHRAHTNETRIQKTTKSLSSFIWNFFQRHTYSEYHRDTDLFQVFLASQFVLTDSIFKAFDNCSLFSLIIILNEDQFFVYIFLVPSYWHGYCIIERRQIMLRLK